MTIFMNCWGLSVNNLLSENLQGATALEVSRKFWGFYFHELPQVVMVEYLKDVFMTVYGREQERENTVKHFQSFLCNKEIFSRVLPDLEKGHFSPPVLFIHSLQRKNEKKKS